MNCCRDIKIRQQLLNITAPNQPNITPPNQPNITPPNQPNITPPNQPNIIPPDQPNIIPPDQPKAVNPSNVPIAFVNPKNSIPFTPQLTTLKGAIHCMENNCTFTCARLTQLKKHLVNEHQINLSETKQQFQTMKGM